MFCVLVWTCEKNITKNVFDLVLFFLSFSFLLTFFGAYIMLPIRNVKRQRTKSCVLLVTFVFLHADTVVFKTLCYALYAPPARFVSRQLVPLFIDRLQRKTKEGKKNRRTVVHFVIMSSFASVVFLLLTDWKQFVQFCRACVVCCWCFAAYDTKVFLFSSLCVVFLILNLLFLFSFFFSLYWSYINLIHFHWFVPR